MQSRCTCRRKAIDCPNRNASGDGREIEEAPDTNARTVGIIILLNKVDVWAVVAIASLGKSSNGFHLEMISACLHHVEQSG